MTTATFRAKLKAVGCTADITMIGRLADYDVMVDAPQGKRFGGTGTHCLVHSSCSAFTEADKAEVRSEAYADTLANLPLDDCTDAECDVCHPPEEIR